MAISYKNFIDNLNNLSKEEKKLLSYELNKNISKVNDIDFFELSKGNKLKAKNLMKKYYFDARKKALRLSAF